MPIDHIQAKQTYRQVNKKDHSPMKVPYDETAGDRAEHGADQTGDGHEAHGADEFRFGECSNHGEPAHGHHHGSAAPLQNAAGDQDVNVARYAAEKRPQVKRPMADENTHRVPKRSAIQPLIGINTARLKV